MGQTVSALLLGVKLTKKLDAKLYPEDGDSLPLQYEADAAVTLTRTEGTNGAIGLVVVCQWFASEFDGNVIDPCDEPIDLDRVLTSAALRQAIAKWKKFAAWCAARKVKLPAETLILATVAVR